MRAGCAGAEGESERVVKMSIYLALALSAVLGFVVSFGLGFAVVPWLHKLNFGQTILDIGPSWHKKKQGTPTMGGILFIAGFAVSLAAVLVTGKLTGTDLLMEGADGRPHDTVYVKIFAGIIMAAGFAFIGFVDDYIKVVKKRNLGLTELQKTAMQLAVIVAYLFTLDHIGAYAMFIPYLGNMFESRFVFWVLGVIAMYATVNAVNFTDGVDGLCTSVTMVACIGFGIVAVILKFTGMTVLCAALFGALAGYLYWNWNPSKVMMGDVGSLFLGGLTIAFAYTLDAPWLIVMIGIIHVLEFGSDLLQIAYVKTHNGKRLFKMAPLHHHYELSGWNEKKIVYVFSAITAIGSAAAVALVWFGRPQ